MTSHLTSYLDYYKTLKNPSYAVLVTGEWGAGKTYQVKKSFEVNEYYYISLFGLDSIEAVHSEVIAAIHPSSSGYGKTFGGIVKDTGYRGLGSLIPSALNAVILKNLNVDRILIFDDFERSNIEIKDLQGVINSYVEHRGCRVIVIAHDDKVISSFTGTKEKIFGQSFSVIPQVKDAYAHFCKLYPKKDNNNFLTKYQSDIFKIFEESKVGSLRILKHIVEDIARLEKIMDDKYLTQKEAMTELIRLFVALNIEIRAGRLHKEDLKAREKAYLDYQVSTILSDTDTDTDTYETLFETDEEKQKRTEDKTDKTLLIQSIQRYESVNLSNNLLQDHLIIEMLIQGNYTKKNLNASLDNHPYFLAAEDVPPWMDVIRFNVLEDKIVTSAIEKMEIQYKNREETNPGDIVHIFCLRLLLSEQGVIADDLDTVLKELKIYVEIYFS